VLIIQFHTLLWLVVVAHKLVAVVRAVFLQIL